MYIENPSMTREDDENVCDFVRDVFLANPHFAINKSDRDTAKHMCNITQLFRIIYRYYMKN